MLAHIVSQVQSNIDFLVSQDYISRFDADQFLAKLPSETTANGVQPTARAPKAWATPTCHPIPAPQAPQGRAIWGYNEGNSVRLPTNMGLDSSFKLLLTVSYRSQMIYHSQQGILLRSWTKRMQIGGQAKLKGSKGYSLPTTLRRFLPPLLQLLLPGSLLIGHLAPPITAWTILLCWDRAP